MPWAAIAALASLAGTGISVGETLANQPSAPPTPTPGPPKPTAPTASQVAGANTTEANAAAAGGGNLSQNYLLSLLSGNDPTGQAFGGAQPTGYGVNPSTITGLLGPNYGIPQ